MVDAEEVKTSRAQEIEVGALVRVLSVSLKQPAHCFQGGRRRRLTGQGPVVRLPKRKHQLSPMRPAYSPLTAYHCPSLCYACRLSAASRLVNSLTGCKRADKGASSLLSVLRRSLTAHTCSLLAAGHAAQQLVCTGRGSAAVRRSGVASLPIFSQHSRAKDPSFRFPSADPGGPRRPSRAFEPPLSPCSV